MPAIMLRYLPQILVVVFISALYLWWRNDLIETAEKRVNAEWIERDLDAARQSVELLKLKQHENKLINEAQEKRSLGAIETYANYSNYLNKQLAAAKRVQVNTTKASGDRNPMSGESPSTCPPPGTSEEDVQRALTIKAVELLIEQYLVPNSQVIDEFN